MTTATTEVSQRLMRHCLFKVIAAAASAATAAKARAVGPKLRDERRAGEFEIV